MTESDIQDDETKTTGWRGSRELWLKAAKQALLDTGVDAVKIQPLAGQLNISRTSFYWFFKDRGALLNALLEEWDAKNTGAFIAASEAYAETVTEGMLNLIGVFLNEDAFEPQFDFAIRSWAHQSDAVMSRVNAADEQRLTAIQSLFERFGFSPDDADTRARTIYLTQIGYISMQVQESLQTRMERIPRYVEIYSGHRPSNRELARFHAAHRFTPESAN